MYWKFVAWERNEEKIEVNTEFNVWGYAAGGAVG
jgi:hypothetical protein